MSIVYLSAKQLASKIQKGSLSSREVLEAFIERKEHFDKGINAVVATQYDAARERADAADRAIAAGERWGPLHGVPMTLKDTWEVTGMPTTAGTNQYRKYHAKRNAPCAQRLIDAGAIVYGKTNVPNLASDIQTYNKVHGTTHNPWSTQRTPGGSSGGAAAALAAGLTPLEFGSDLAGSIRIPAHFCGVYGHKPTFGIVPMRGHIPGPPGMVTESPMAVGGPLARTVDDLQLALDLVAGPTGMAANGLQLKLPLCPHKQLADFKVLCWFDDPLCPLDPDLRHTYQQLTQQLKSLGVQVTEGAPAGFSLKTGFEMYMHELGGIFSATLPSLGRTAMSLGSPLMARIENYLGSPMLDQLMRGLGQSHAEWIGHSEKVARFGERFAKVFSQYDVILMPITPGSAFPHQHKPILQFRNIEINGEKRSYSDNFMWIAIASLFGLPATVMPIGKCRQQLPVGLQIMAGPYEDKTSLQFAKLLSRETEGFTIPPGFTPAKS